LTDFEECTTPYDWTLGTHGIYIHLSERGSQRPLSNGASKPASTGKSLIHRGPGIISATFLPDVAPAQGWDQTQTLDAAIRKAGWSCVCSFVARVGI
jgi:AMMECR1 domain-containing protein